MLDSTQFNEVYNTTGDILQNVPPTTPIVGYAMAGVILCIIISRIYKKKWSF